jgi:pimeloyl-ACP methyl ester carboxylesterase
MPPTAPAIVRANGIDLCYQSFGEASAAPMVLIMGLAGQMINWEDDFCTQLAARGYRVIRFDNRDVGMSTHFGANSLPDVGAAMIAAMQGRPLAAPYLLGDMAADTFGLMDALDIGTAHVVGASMGGAIAQTMAIARPERLRTLTSIMSTTGAPDLPPPTAEAMAVLFGPSAGGDSPNLLTSMLQSWKALHGSGFSADHARDFERAGQSMARGIDPGGVARQLAAVLASGSRREALRNVEVPTLVIHGRADPLVPLACGLDTANAVPGAELLVLDGMGHALPVELWPQIIDAIARHASDPET